MLRVMTVPYAEDIPYSAMLMLTAVLTAPLGGSGHRRKLFSHRQVKYAW
jgi:hypothetical protein